MGWLIQLIAAIIKAVLPTVIDKASEPETAVDEGESPKAEQAAGIMAELIAEHYGKDIEGPHENPALRDYYRDFTDAPTERVPPPDDPA